MSPYGEKLKAAKYAHALALLNNNEKKSYF
jgi:hypothetical protein